MYSIEWRRVAKYFSKQFQFNTRVFNCTDRTIDTQTVMQQDVREGLNQNLHLFMDSVNIQGESASKDFQVYTNNIPFSVVEDFMSICSCKKVIYIIDGKRRRYR